jgi:hypothetical protein
MSAPALETLLSDLVRCFAPGAPALRIAVADAAAADLTVRPVEHGFELLFAHGRLAHVRGELDVIEYCGALVALYLEEGQGDSPADFVARVGLRYIQERVQKDAVGRAALFRRAWQSSRGEGTRCIVRPARIGTLS